jgi:hypothetical protein
MSFDFWAGTFAAVATIVLTTVINILLVVPFQERRRILEDRANRMIDADRALNQMRVQFRELGNLALVKSDDEFVLLKKKLVDCELSFKLLEGTIAGSRSPGLWGVFNGYQEQYRTLNERWNSYTALSADNRDKFASDIRETLESIEVEFRIVARHIIAILDDIDSKRASRFPRLHS